MRLLTTEEFVAKSNIVHSNFYSYPDTYKNSIEKIKILCPIHGIFEQEPRHHLKGHRCSKCAGNKQLISQDFIEKAVKIHKNFYIYSKVIYKNTHSKVKIICPLHGEFEQSPNRHLYGQGCSQCGGSLQSNTEEFINKAVKIHNGYYSY